MIILGNIDAYVSTFYITNFAYYLYSFYLFYSKIKHLLGELSVKRISYFRQ